jgi:putative FmdB family regulatory protein
MPLYEYECEACHHRFETIQKFSDPPVAICPSCGAGPVKKLLSSPAIQFKGTGWYITDYAKKSGADAGRSGSTKSDSSAKTDAKSDAKSDASSSTDTSAGTTTKSE